MKSRKQQWELILILTKSVFPPSRLSVEEKCFKKSNKIVPKYKFNFLGFYNVLLTYFNNQRKFSLGNIQYMNEFQLGKPEKSVLLWREIWTNIGFFFPSWSSWLECKPRNINHMTVIAHHEIYPCFNRLLELCLGVKYVREKEEMNTFGEAIINVQQVIVSNESDVIEKSLHMCIFCGLQCI